MNCPLESPSELRSPTSIPSQTSHHFYEVLNPFCYWRNDRYFHGDGMWKAVACGNENALLRFIAQRADMCAWRSAPSSKRSSIEESSDEEEEEKEEKDSEEDNGFPHVKFVKPVLSDSDSETEDERPTQARLPREFYPLPGYIKPPKESLLCYAFCHSHILSQNFLLSHGAPPRSQELGRGNASNACMPRGS